MNYFTTDKKEWKELRSGFEKTVIFNKIKAVKNTLTTTCVILVILLLGMYFDTKTIPYEAFIIASMLEAIGQVILYKFTYEALYRYAKSLKENK